MSSYCQSKKSTKNTVTLKRSCQGDYEYDVNGLAFSIVRTECESTWELHYSDCGIIEMADTKKELASLLSSVPKTHEELWKMV